MGDLDSFNDAILAVLECPVCTEYMSPPIFQCKTGHKLCSRCRPQLSVCPTCKETCLDLRNYVAEELAEKLMYPCVNEDAGCRAKLQLRAMARHNAECPCRLYDCLGADCDWRGRAPEMLQHLKGSHGMAWMTAQNPHLYYDRFDLSSDFYERDAIDAFGQLFWYHFRRDAEKRRVFVAVQFVGDEKRASEYRYQVFLFSPDGKQWVDFVNVTHKDTVSFDQIIDSKKCCCVDFELVEDLLDDDLTLKFRINLCESQNSSISNAVM
ncbi:probable E3 ubiquitin-protein ligase sinah [Bacillus rossius redtenbacheri]|uniref:probable E3 ubiquitin-protein ligase sinah n=1 Tax=Bacillus rossius redtenbacheri TaxID=93214 RepID=UPI002FDCA957